MEPSQIASLMENAILTVFFMAAPMLLIGLAVGVFVSIFQAVTQINEVTLVFIPKMLGVGVVMWLLGPWMYGRLAFLVQEVAARVSVVSGAGM